MGKNSEITVENGNLKSWKPGQSGNPDGRPKGSRNLKTIIKSLLNDTSVYDRLSDWEYTDKSNTPIEAIVLTLVTKAVDGDTKSAELLFKYGYDKDERDDSVRYETVVRFLGHDDEELDM